MKRRCLKHSVRHHSIIGLMLLSAAGLALLLLSEKTKTGQSTGSLAVSATVNANCVFKGTSGVLNFGTYDPIDVNATNPLDVDGSFDIRCTKNTAAQLGIGFGLHASGSTRRMENSGVFLNYEIYKEAGRTSIWGDTGADRVPYTAVNNQFYTEIVFGRVPGGQDVSAGAYSDTATLTADF